VPSKVDRRTAVGREIEATLHKMGEPVGPAIGARAAFVDSATAGAWIGAYAARTALASAHPHQVEFALAHARLSAAAP
jgi:chromosome partitioning protein